MGEHSEDQNMVDDAAAMLQIVADENRELERNYQAVLTKTLMPGIDALLAELDLQYWLFGCRVHMSTECRLVQLVDLVQNGSSAQNGIKKSHMNLCNSFDDATGC